MKYGLMSYDYTINLGNEIQSIAARRFLPETDYYIDHEELHKFTQDRDVKLIMNGWYLDTLEAWPPSDNIDPLLISMHFNSNEDTQKVILSDESKEFFKKNGPVGCRDKFTKDFLSDNDIDAYFSGCLTLTLDSGNKFNWKDDDNSYVLVSMDHPEEVISFLKKKTQKKIYVINQDFMPSFDNAFYGSMPINLYNGSTFYTFDEKMFIAENFLRLYENADCVITDRLHCSLPCLALQTPVLLFNVKSHQERFEDLNELIHRTTMEDYLNNYNIFDVDNPPENSKSYLKIRKNLIDKCKKFTGHINESCFSNLSFNEMLDKNTLLISKHSFESRKYMKQVLRNSRDDKRKIKKQKNSLKKKKQQLKEKNNLIKNQKQIIHDYENSNSRKIISSLKKIKRN